MDIELQSKLDGRYDLTELQMELALKYRKIYLNDTITADSVYHIVFLLQKILELDAETKTKKPITLYIDTEGGVCAEGFVLVDMIQALKDAGYVIKTIVIGTAYSFGLVLAVMGTERYCYKHADFMYHQVRLQIYESSLENHSRIGRQAAKTDKQMKEVIASHSDLTIKEMEDADRKCQDWFFDAEEAVAKKLCDQIL